jgi:hypothetical protein
MSFQNYDQFQGQPTGEQPNQAGSQPDLGQQMDTSGNGFPPQGNMGPPGSSGGPDSQSGTGKTTLWWVSSTYCGRIINSAHAMVHRRGNGVCTRTWRLTGRRMGELEPWIDENFVRSIWYNMGETVNVKMIRDKFSG